jgi:ATP-binding cassette subfamily B protein
MADPGHGLIKYTTEEFLKGWMSTKADGEEKGVALLLEPTPNFYATQDEKPDKTKLNFIFNYLKPYKKYIVQLLFRIVVG